MKIKCPATTAQIDILGQTVNYSQPDVTVKYLSAGVSVKVVGRDGESFICEVSGPQESLDLIAADARYKLQ